MNYKFILVLGVAFLISNASARVKTRIIGGTEGNIEDYPYQASLRLLNYHQCGGSIISKKHILTAAHCFIFKFLTPIYRIYTGTSYSNDTGHVHEIEKIDIHPNWIFDSAQGYTNDIAIVTLKDEIEFDKYQQKIDLPTKKAEDGLKVNLTGWGMTTNNPDDRPLQLQSLETNIITSSQCHPQTADVTAKQICTLREKGVGPCHGDSGGPLAADGEIVGIVSWTDNEDACATGAPEVYTNVYAYREYIEAIINDEK